jgi:transcriptional regulator with XRE-family HTH domain
MSFAERLKALRKRADMTQEALARAADVSNATVAKLERGGGQDPNWSTVCKLADALGISVAEFRDGDESEPTPSKGKGKKGVRNDQQREGPTGRRLLPHVRGRSAGQHQHPQPEGSHRGDLRSERLETGTPLR